MNNEYKIRIPHFYCLEYYEGNKKMVLDIDFREKQIVLSRDMIKNWENPYENITLQDKEKRRILENIRNYLLKNNSPERIVMAQ